MICALVGHGYWGQILRRKVEASSLFELKYICDVKWSSSSVLSGVHYTSALDELLRDDEVEAIFVVTPPTEHFEVARRALLAHKHIWLEKPCCSTREEFAELTKLAKRQSLSLQVDFISLFNPLIREMKRVGASIFKPHERARVSAMRHNRESRGRRENNNSSQSTLDLFYDLGVHDLSILRSLYPHLKLSDLGVTLIERTADQGAPRVLLMLDHDDFEAEIDLMWSGAEKRRELTWGKENSWLQFTLERSNNQWREALYHHQAEGKYEICSPRDEDSIEIALSAFAQGISQRSSNVEMWEIADFCHRFITRLEKSKWSEPYISD